MCANVPYFLDALRTLRVKKPFVVKRVEGLPIDLTGKNKFAWFTFHAEAESAVVQGFRIQGAIQPGGPTVAGGSGTITLAIVRARSKPTVGSIDDVEEEELIGTYVFGWGQAVATDQRTYISGNACFDCFSKRKVRLPINSGLYLGVYFNASNDHVESSLLGITTIYKKVA